jgi:DNA polymerase-1
MHYFFKVLSCIIKTKIKFLLYDIYKNFDPEYMAVSFDKNKQTFRSEVYKEYKATRKPAPPELVPQFALIREALRTLGAAGHYEFLR